MTFMNRKDALMLYHYGQLIAERFSGMAPPSCLTETPCVLRAHPLADALFRADAWSGRTVLSLYIGNPRFREGPRGRKPRTADILSGAEPPFRVEELRLAAGHAFGRVHLPGGDQIRAVARRINAS